MPQKLGANRDRQHKLQDMNHISPSGKLSMHLITVTVYHASRLLLLHHGAAHDVSCQRLYIAFGLWAWWGSVVNRSAREPWQTVNTSCEKRSRTSSLRDRGSWYWADMPTARTVCNTR